MLALTLLLAGSMTYDRQSGMTYLLKATARGRGALVIRKLLLAAAMTALIWAVVYGMEVYTFLTKFTVTAWSAPAKNLSMLSEFPLNCSVAAVLALLYVFRWLMLFCGAGVVLFISSRVKRMEAAYIAGSAVMLIPSVLYAYMGLEIFRPLAVILPVESMPLLLSGNGALTYVTLAAIALLAAAAASIACISVQAKTSN